MLPIQMSNIFEGRLKGKYSYGKKTDFYGSSTSTSKVLLGKKAVLRPKQDSTVWSKRWRVILYIMVVNKLIRTLYVY